MKRPVALQTRLLVLLMGWVTLVWLGAAVATWADARHEVDELLDSHLAQTAALLVLQADSEEDEIADAPVLHKYAPQVAFQVFVEGRLVSRSSSAGQVALSTTDDGFSTVRDAAGNAWRVFATQDTHRELVVYVGERVQPRQAIVWAVMRSMLWPVLIALPLLALAVAWSVRQGLAPVRRLSALLHTRVTPLAQPLHQEDLPAELRPLVQALNALLERVDHMVAQERRFTADAAHELRTPIAAIRLQAQVALGAGDNVAERDHALALTLAGCDRAARLVEQLLTLARLENAAGAQGFDPQSAPVDLGQVVRQVAADLAPQALARGQTLACAVQGDCRLALPEMLLAVLVRNLLDNALRYSPHAAQVRVELDRVVSQEGAHMVFTVQDSGPGMTEQQIARLGERFFRAAAHAQTGSGLGWSIVRHLLATWGAQVSIGRSAMLGGLAVTVRWPLRQAP